MSEHNLQPPAPNKLPPCDHDECGPVQCELPKAIADMAEPKLLEEIAKPLDQQLMAEIDRPKSENAALKAKLMSELCPLCKGQGHVSKPRHIAGDVNEWTDSAASHQCWICGGSGILGLEAGNVDLGAEIAALKAKLAEAEAIIAKHSLCHDLHGKVGRDEFEDGCRRETIKEFGSCGWAEKLAEAEKDKTRLNFLSVRSWGPEGAISLLCGQTNLREAIDEAMKEEK